MRPQSRKTYFELEKLEVDKMKSEKVYSGKELLASIPRKFEFKNVMPLYLGY
jgi:hypothetical protein